MKLFPEQASTSAVQVDQLALVLLLVSCLFCLGIGVALCYFLLRYSDHRTEVDRRAPLIDNLKLELLWILVPLALALGLFGWSASLYVDLQTPKEKAVEIFVLGKQWMWQIQHPTGRRELNHLHLPSHTPVQLTMISQDVIHSFFVPAFRQKQDVVPGRYSYLHLEATQEGEFHLFCAEYCGSEHARMGGKVTVMAPDEYQSWVQEGDEPEPRDLGKHLFERHGCAGCHSAASSTPAPVLERIYGKTVTFEGGQRQVVDEDYLRESILEPQAKVVAGFEPIMPTYEGSLNEEQLRALVVYLRTLGSERP